MRSRKNVLQREFVKLNKLKTNIANRKQFKSFCEQFINSYCIQFLIRHYKKSEYRPKNDSASPLL